MNLQSGGLTSLWLPVALTFFAGGFVKGAVGLGMPTVVLALLNAYMSLGKAAALLVIPSLVTNGWQLFVGPRLLGLSRRTATLLAAMALGTVFAPFGMVSASSRITTLALGVLLAAYALFGLLALRMSIAPRHERWASPLVGAVCGLLNASTGLFVMPLVPYLQSLDLSKDELVQALALGFMAGALSLALRLQLDGIAVFDASGESWVALAAAQLGMPIGSMLRARASEHLFRMAFFTGLLVLGAVLAVKSFRP